MDASRFRYHAKPKCFANIDFVEAKHIRVASTLGERGNMKNCNDCIHLKVCLSYCEMLQQYVKRVQPERIIPSFKDDMDAEDCEDYMLPPSPNNRKGKTAVKKIRRGAAASPVA